MDKGRSPNFKPVGFAPTRAHNVKPKLALMSFRAAVDFPRRCIKSLREELKLLNHRFQIGKNSIFGWQCHTGYIGHNRPLFRHLVQALPDNLETFVHFLNANPIAIVGIPVLANGNTELAFGIGTIGIIFSEIIIHARAAQGGTTQPKAESILCGDHRHPSRPSNPNAVVF